MGLNTDCTPLGSKNEPEKPSTILQLCVEFMCLIFQLKLSLDILWSLITFFNNPKYNFTCLEIKKDFEKLAHKRAFLEFIKKIFGSNIVDLRERVMQKGLSKDKEGVGMISLAKMVLGNDVKKD
ncbi:Werner syndrome-like exonuclease [Tanacetum coccineum]